ncbi:MAG TPA: histidine kinase [Steroidobacteraceae bacterium]|nr:histidine kinase [Steroidobacteraceae bacterium]
MDVPQRSSRNYWLCQLIGWGLYGATEAAAAVQILRLPLLRSVLEITVWAGGGLALSHVLRGVLRRRGWARLPLRALVPRILALSLLLALPMAVLTHYMAIAALWGPDQVDIDHLHIGPGMLGPARLLILVLNWTTCFVVWTVLYLSITSLRDRRSAALRQSELTRALQLSELRLLKSQLNPHFLFNSLNSVRALIADDPAAAQKAVTQLARTLRYTLTAGREELVPLARELEIVEDYLALESLRFGERLRIERNIAPEAMNVRVPVMLLQTVVENAIKHGIAELPAGGDLRIVATLRGGTLQLDVENTRPEKTGSVFRGEGVGLDNAAERLRLLFGARANLELDLSQAEIAIARIRIPETA